MTDQPKRQPASRRNARSTGVVWKSGLLALSVATVVSGTALLGRAEGGQPPSAQASAQTAQQVVVVQQLPSGDLLVRRDVPLDSLSNGSFVDIPSMPQRPVFQQPITRTRGS